MNNFIGRRGLHLLIGATLACAAGISHAQYVWVNEKGVRQISDKAPPASVPAQNIIRSPAGSGLPPPVPLTPTAAPKPLAAGAPGSEVANKDAAGKDVAGKDAAGKDAAGKVAPTPAQSAAAAAKAAADAKLTPDQIKLAEREADYKKRQKEAAEAAEKEKAERKAKAEKKANCDLAKQYGQSLDSSVPIVLTSEKGEQTVLSDADRKKMLDNTKRVSANCR